jgi:hypothetical protein
LTISRGQKSDELDGVGFLGISMISSVVAKMRKRKKNGFCCGNINLVTYQRDFAAPHKRIFHFLAGMLNFGMKGGKGQL